MSLERLFETPPAPTPVKITGLYELLDAFAPYRAQWEEAQEQEKTAYAAYARELKQIQERCPHPLSVDGYIGRSEPFEPDEYLRTCLACGSNDSTYNSHYARPAVFPKINSKVILRIGDWTNYSKITRLAPVPSPVIRKILRAAKERTNVDIEALMMQWRKRRKS